MLSSAVFCVLVVASDIVGVRSVESRERSCGGAWTVLPRPSGAGCVLLRSCALLVWSLQPAHATLVRLSLKPGLTGKCFSKLELSLNARDGREEGGSSFPFWWLSTLLGTLLAVSDGNDAHKVLSLGQGK